MVVFQAVRIPEGYIDEVPVNTNPVENVAYNSDPVYELYGKIVKKYELSSNSGRLGKYLSH